MKAAIIFTGTGPILILTTYDSLTSPSFAEKLRQKGIRKYIACEVEAEIARQRYGQHFDVIMKDVKQDDDLRVLDYNGFNVFNVFSFKEMAKPLFVEPE